MYTSDQSYQLLYLLDKEIINLQSIVKLVKK